MSNTEAPPAARPSPDVIDPEAKSQPERASGILRRWTPLLRALVTIGLLWFVLRRVELADLVTLFARGMDRWPLLAFALVLPALGLLIAAYRWQLLLQPQGYVPRLRRLFAAHLVGAFFNQFLPSTIGGDLARSWWVSKALGTPIVNVTVVGVDRLVGLVGVCATASLAAILVPSMAGQVWQTWAVLSIGVVFAGGMLTVGGRRTRLAGRWVFSLPQLRILREKAILIYRVLAVYRARRKRLLAAVLLSILIQLLVIIQYSILAIALTIDVAIWELAVIIPIVTLVALIPITINGLGLRENSLAALGALVGLSPVDAVALAWIVTAGTLCYAVVGGLTHALGRQTEDPRGVS